MTSFEVIGQKSLTGQITAMEWCPTMDLLALVTADSQLMVHRPAGWQRLFVHTGFDHPITCLAWRPDGQVLAVGHADGSATLFGVEEGEQLGTSKEHADALSTFCWVPATVDTGTATAKGSPYACSLAGLFAPLPQLPKQGSVQQHLLEEGTPALDVALYKLLFEADRSLAFDIAVTADAAARVHLAVHGRFSLGCLRIGALPSLEFATTPRILAVKLAPSLHALTVIVHASCPAQSLLPDGNRQVHAPGTLLLAFRTGQLTRANLEIRALALSYMQCEALATRAKAALEAAHRLWSEAASPLIAKMTTLEEELKANGRPGTIAEELISLLACGVPPSCLHSYIVRELREADLSKILKAIGVATSALVQICVTQVHPALEMLVQRLSHLHGLSRWPYHFAALGLQPSRVGAALDSAIGLRATAELLLLSVRRSNAELGGLLAWLIRIYRKMRDETPSTEELPPLNAKGVGAFLLRLAKGAPGRDLEAYVSVAAGKAASEAAALQFDQVSDLFAAATEADGGGGDAARPPAGLASDDLSELSGLPPTQRVPAAIEQLEATLGACFSPVAQHVSAGFQLHSCTSLDASDAGDANAATPAYDLMQLDAAAAADKDGGSAAVQAAAAQQQAQQQQPTQLLIAAPQLAGSALADRGVQLLLLRARWTLQDAVPPSWEVCALGGCAHPLLQAHFYKTDHVALLHAPSGGGTALQLCDHEELTFLPLQQSMQSAGSSAGGEAVACLRSRALAMLIDGALTVSPLGDDDGACGERSRTFPRLEPEAAKVALSHERGMASIVTKARRIVLLDLEEEGDDEGEEGEEGEEGANGEEVEIVEAAAGGGGSDDDGMDMDEDDS